MTKKVFGEMETARSPMARPVQIRINRAERGPEDGHWAVSGLKEGA